MEIGTLIAIVLAPLYLYLLRRFLSKPLERAMFRRFGRYRLIRVLTKERDGY